MFGARSFMFKITAAATTIIIKKLFCKKKKIKNKNIFKKLFCFRSLFNT